MVSPLRPQVLVREGIKAYQYPACCPLPARGRPGVVLESGENLNSNKIELLLVDAEAVPQIEVRRAANRLGNSEPSCTDCSTSACLRVGQGGMAVC
jgi:hypothetical protein